jgi:hypothetical protein
MHFMNDLYIQSIQVFIYTNSHENHHSLNIVVVHLMLMNGWSGEWDGVVYILVSNRNEWNP